MCSAQNTPWTCRPCPSQHWLPSALGTNVAAAAAAPLPALEGKRSRLLFPAGKPGFTSRGMLVCPFGNTHLPSAGTHCTTAGLPLCPSPGRDNPAGAGHGPELLLCPGASAPQSHPGPARLRPPAVATLSQQGKAARGAGGRAGRRQAVPARSKGAI